MAAGEGMFTADFADERGVPTKENGKLLFLRSFCIDKRRKISYNTVTYLVRDAGRRAFGHSAKYFGR